MPGGTFNLNLPNVQFPVLGAAWWIGFTFLVHIVIAAWSMGIVVLAPTYELIGKLTGDPRWDRYARGLATNNLRLFSLGAVFGSFAVFSLVGLYPRLFTTLMTIFFIPMLYAFSSWFLTIAAEIVYVYRWSAWAGRKWLHIGTGYVGGIVEQSFLFFIVGLDSYMLTPGKGIGFGSFFNPSFWPELLHRFVGNLSWASFLIATVMIVYLALRWESRDAPYYRWAASVSVMVGFTLLIPQAALGVAYVESIKLASRRAFHYSFSGSMAWMWIVQQAFFGIVLLGTNAYFWQTRHRAGITSPLFTAVTLACSVLGLLPSAAYPHNVFWLRYVFFGLSLLLTLAHLVAWQPWIRAPRPDLDRIGRWMVGVAGITAVLLFLLMGVIRETTRGAGSRYTVYGLQTQGQSQDMFYPPHPTFYP